MGTESTSVGPVLVRDNDRSRAAWGNQLDPVDLACRTIFK